MAREVDEMFEEAIGLEIEDTTLKLKQRLGTKIRECKFVNRSNGISWFKLVEEFVNMLRAMGYTINIDSEELIEVLTELNIKANKAKYDKNRD